MRAPLASGAYHGWPLAVAFVLGAWPPLVADLVGAHPLGRGACPVDGGEGEEATRSHRYWILSPSSRIGTPRRSSLAEARNSGRILSSSPGLGNERFSNS